MRIEEFEELVDRHSLCPGNFLYNSNALAGEAGEVANVVKKREMAIMMPEWVTQNQNSLPSVSDFEKKLWDELGDQLFYLVRVAHDNGLSLEEVMYRQAEKLNLQSIQYGRTFLK